MPGLTSADARTPTLSDSPDAKMAIDVGKDIERAIVDPKAAQESLIHFCKPTELYEVFRTRAQNSPCFLKRTLSYKIQAARDRRTKMTVALLNLLPGGQTAAPVSVFVQITSAVPNVENGFRLSRARLLTDNGQEGIFSLPELNKLISHLKKEDDFILFIVFENKNRTHKSLECYTGNVYWGKLSMTTVTNGWKEHLQRVNGNVAFNWKRVESLHNVELNYGVLQHQGSSDGHRHMIFGSDNETNPGNIRSKNLPPLKLRITGEEKGLSSQLLNDLATRPFGLVVFHFVYYFKTLRQIEATVDFGCPFCMAKWSSYKGLKYHLSASHDRFLYEFLPEIQAIIVMCKSEITGMEEIEREVDLLQEPHLKTFCYYFSPKDNGRKRKLKNGNRIGDLPILQTDANEQARKQLSVGSTRYRQAIPEIHIIPDDPSPEEEKSLASTSEQDADTMKRVPRTNRRFSQPPAKRRRVTEKENGNIIGDIPVTLINKKKMGSVIRAATNRDRCPLPPSKKLVKPPGSRLDKSRKDRTLLFKRQFYHAHTGQPMEIEQVLSDRDSEDELDDVIASLEDRRLLGEFVDVTKDEMHLMHLWNDFVRRQRVIADNHMPWACESFAKLHREAIHDSSILRRCFMMLLMKLWNYDLLNSEQVSQCLDIVDRDL